MSPALRTYNPLPSALAHYAAALHSSLDHGTSVVAGPGVEAEGRSAARRVRLLEQHMASLLSHPREPLLDLWPGLGHWEPAVLARRRGRSAVVFHDPTPLRRAAGYGTRAVRAGARASSRVTVVAHSRAAEHRLSELGYVEVQHVPHPVVVGRVFPGDRSPVVRVLGQYKHQRDTDLLVSVAGHLARQGLDAEVMGRGWPAVTGWRVHDGFLDEGAFDVAVRTAAAVVIPYRHYWQSGVALRALERGTPVVGPADGFLSEVFGSTWPGLVGTSEVSDPEAWAAAVARVVGLPVSQCRVVLDQHDAAARAGLLSLVRSLTQTP